MLKGFPEVSDEIYSQLKHNEIEIILNRLRRNLSEQDRNNILGILSSKSLKDKKDLVFFLLKLSDIYNKQKEIDLRIKTFVEICNNYLENKHFIFNESLVSVTLERTFPKQDVMPLSSLSSGEKQIVSIFSKIYLQDFKNCILLFDEPELSLTLGWQRNLLPDLSLIHI